MKLLDTKYSNMYILLFIITTLIRYSLLLFKIDTGNFPVNLISGVTLLLYYLSLTKKSNIWLTIILILAILSTTAIIKTQLRLTSISIILLIRIATLIYSYQIINWNKIKGTNIISASVLLILFCSLIFIMFINNFEFYKNNILFELIAVCCEIILMVICLISFLNFLHNQNKQNKYFLIGVVLSLIGDIIYTLQNLTSMVSPIILIISSILYSTCFYLIIQSDKIREKKLTTLIEVK